MIYGVMCPKMSGDWKRWSFTTIRGGNVPKDEVEAARGQLDQRTFRQDLKRALKI